jgi:HAD superfamily hydrolase (TIGR01509 family)
MTARQGRADDVLRPVKHVLLDFDGPVAAVFAGYPAAEVARDLRDRVTSAAGSVSADWAAETDPLALLRRVAADRGDLTLEADRHLSRLEQEAVATARPTPGAESFLRACADAGRSVWVVSNNAGGAISSYLAAHGLSDLVSGVFGRQEGDPSSMKPSPRLLLDAVAAAGASTAQCVFVGDAVRDVEAANAAGMPAIGYANKPGKADRLAAAGAVVVLDSMTELAAAVR